MAVAPRAMRALSSLLLEKTNRAQTLSGWRSGRPWCPNSPRFLPPGRQESVCGDFDGTGGHQFMNVQPRLAFVRCYNEEPDSCVLHFSSSEQPPAVAALRERFDHSTGTIRAAFAGQCEVSIRVSDNERATKLVPFETVLKKKATLVDVASGPTGRGQPFRATFVDVYRSSGHGRRRFIVKREARETVEYVDSSLVRVHVDRGLVAAA
ncbi:unnamed protein product [Amoebophrya sp. A25]|nr:unnamed protein product [Amoebophrya sp. A25]|eukprot:GSA25T00007699001.1